MDIGTISLVLMLGLLVLLAIGMPLGLASAVLAVLVLFMKFEPNALLWPFYSDVTWEFGDGFLTARPGAGPLNILAQKIYGLLTDYVLISIPLFIFMAALLERSGIAKDMYSSLNVWLNRTRGGIAIVTSIMAVIMAAMSGIIGGEVVLLGLIALPQMLRLGYNQNLAIGTICASGSLGTMIPPSIVLIIFGLITETSIKALFTAAFLPGFMLASFIIIYIVIRTQLNPSLAPLPDPVEGEPQGTEKTLLFTAFLNVLLGGFSAILFLRALFFTVTGQNAAVEGVEPIFWGTPDYVPWFGGLIVISLVLMFFAFGRERTATGWSMGKGLVPPIVVIGVVLGSIYGGITGITEAAGMGAISVLILAILRGEASLELVWDSLMRTLKSTGTIIWVTIGAAALAGAYTIAGGPTYVANAIVGSDLPTMGILLMMMLMLLFMGAFMDWVGIVLLIIPVFLPIVQRMPIEEIGLIGELQPKYLAVWFGVLFCMNMQVSFLSPPFGPAAFYLKSVAPPHIALTDIFKGFLPFICIQIMALSVLLIWPPIVEILLN
ncbi:MAG: TRAP transporter large permease subunit [Pseudomonadota bacterium]